MEGKVRLVFREIRPLVVLYPLPPALYKKRIL